MDKEQQAIEYIRMASEMSLQYHEKPLMVLYSGGKDSEVILRLTQAAGVPYEVQHSHTTADAPQTVYHVRGLFHNLECQGIHCEINYPIYKGQRTSLWRLIELKGPPTRKNRFCCSICKETAGRDRVIVSGVRRSESTRRSDRLPIEAIAATKAKCIRVDPLDNDDQLVLSNYIILNNDNDPNRKIIERCQMQGKIMCNPIAYWSSSDVWAYTEAEKLPINPVYAMGFSRVGCVGCPMAGLRGWKEFKVWPAYKDMYIHAFDRFVGRLPPPDQRKSAYGRVWKTGEDVFYWLMEDKNIEGQVDFEWTLKLSSGNAQATPEGLILPDTGLRMGV